jgi:hypothetical protein
MTIRTDTIGHAVDDLSDARIRGADLTDTTFACIEMDDGDRLRCVERSPGQWEAWSDNRDAAYPL